MDKLAKILKAIFNKNNSTRLVAIGVGILALEMVVKPPEVFLYFFTPLD
jgi:hypothetical protein